MGSPLSPVLANLYMEWFEQTALSSAAKPPKMWKRYVDDTFTIFSYDSDDLAKFLDHLNNIAPTIRFTMEVETNKSLSFLDVLVTRDGEQLTTSVYYKKTHTGRYLDYNSNHTQGVKKGIIKCLASRSKAICSPTTLQTEMNNLVETFEMNGYPQEFIKSALTSERKERAEDPPTQTVCLPYIPGTSEKLGRICKEFKIRTVYRSSDTLGRRLTKVKPRTDMGKKKNVIYEIPCECGESYIGETLRPLETRIAEHKRCCREGNSSSGVAEHMWSKQHDIKWANVRILDSETGWTKRKIKEAMYMKLQGNVFSQPSKQPSETWLPLLRKV